MSRKLKLYISKSKAGKIDDLMKVRSLLTSYDFDILEFSGGTYSTDLINQADVVLFLYPNLPKPFAFQETIGKGQHVELVFCLSNQKSFYFINCLGDELYVSKFVKYSILDINWQFQFSKIHCDNSMEALHFYYPDNYNLIPNADLDDLELSEIEEIDNDSKIPTTIHLMVYKKLFK